jgi:uncharacterized protein (TIGR03000 family)
MGLYAGIGYHGFGAYGNFGIYGTMPVFGAPVYSTPNFPDPRSGYQPGFELLPVGPKPVEELRPPEKKSSALPDTRAAIVVTLPSDAKVYIDGNLMKSTSTERIFTSPTLEPGEAYYYTLRVVAVKDGKEVEAIRRVSVRAGETSRISLETAFDRPRSSDRTIVDVSTIRLR